jgi:hypothetical protein
MNDDLDKRDLSQFANASGQSNQPTRPPQGHSLVRPTSGIAERVIGAQPVAVYRDEQKILQKLATLAAAAGSDWFYRFPVRKAGGGQDFIEGPSIKLANDVARIFGNCAIEVRELDVGDAWVFYARFTDIETGFSMERAYRQRKSQGSMKTKDADRQLDIAYQIGQSKAIRNVITNGLQLYCDYAFEQARDSLVEKIGKALDAWRKRTVEGLAKMPVELARVERTIGRAAKDWLAPDIARIVASMKSVADGMATTDEVFPPATEVSPPSSGTPSAADGEAAQGAGSADHAETRDPVSEQDEGGEEDGEIDPVQVAYERGVQAKAAGSTPKALPGEYRTPDRTAEALAWRAGLDGQPKPQAKT